MTVLDILLVVILLAWIGGFGFHIAGSAIHLLLVLLVILLIVRFATGRRTVL